jgi:hypothetical protein
MQVSARLMGSFYSAKYRGRFGHLCPLMAAIARNNSQKISAPSFKKTSSDSAFIGPARKTQCYTGCVITRYFSVLFPLRFRYKFQSDL